MDEPAENGIVERIANAAGLIIGVSDSRSWIEVFFEGDLMHTRSVDLPARSIFDIYVEEVPHKATVYEHPRTMIFFAGPCDLTISSDGGRIVVSGAASASGPGNVA